MTTNADNTLPSHSLPPVASASGEREKDAELAAFWAACIEALKAMDVSEGKAGA